MNGLGISIHRDLTPGAPSAITIAAGRWALAAQSTIPFVEIRAAGRSTLLTWGHVVEVADHDAAQVISASFHKGDATLVQVDSAPPRPPAAITLHAGWTLNGAQDTWTTRQIDVRTARRVYLWIGNLLTEATVAWTRTHRAFEIGEPNAPGSIAVVGSNGVVIESVTTASFHAPLPCGIGSGQHRDTAVPGRTLQALCPHALRDTVQVSAPVADLNAVGFEIDAGAAFADSFFVVEY